MDIKRFCTYLAFAVMPVLALSCVKGEDFPSGQTDMYCYGVYFPTQSNATDLEFAPTDEKTVSFVVKRKNDDDKITVPCEISGSDIFEVSDIVFDEGQKETTLEVSFPKAEKAKKYQCTIAVTDPRYSDSYSLEPAVLQFSVTVVEWTQIGNATWRDDFFSSFFTVQSPYAETSVPIFERNDKPGYYRLDNVYTAEYMSLLMTGTKDNASGFASYCYDSSIYIDATDDSKVYIVKSKPGLNLGSGIGDVTFASEVTENGFESGSGYATNVNGVIEFPSGTLMVLMPEYKNGDWSYANNSGKLRILLPGAVVYDYSVTLAAGLSAEGNLPVQFTLGKNITNVKYVLCEGRLSDTEIAQMSQNLADGKLDNVNTVSQTALVTVTCPSTGVYTIVTANYDPTGKYRGYSSVVFSYLAAGDNTKSVVIDNSVIISNKYASQGLTSENSMEYYVYGKDIVDAYVAIFRKSDLDGISSEDLWQLMKQNPSNYRLSDSQVAEINNSEFSGVIGNLAPGTEYDFIVIASNGYQRQIFHKIFSTEGEHNILYDNIKDSQLAVMTIHDYCREWDFYAVDLLNGDGKRERIGKVTLAEAEMQDGHNSMFTAFLKATGAIGQKPLKFGVKDELIFGFYAGFIFPLYVEFGEVDYYGVKVYPTSVFITSLGYSLPGEPLLLGGVFMDNAVAFAEFGQGNTMYGDFIGWGVGMFGDKTAAYQQLGMMSAYSDIMFLDPSVSATLPSSSSVGTTASMVRAPFAGFKMISNYVETPEGRFLSAIDRHLEGRGLRNYMEFNGIRTEHRERGTVPFAASTRKSANLATRPLFVLK